VSELIGNFFLYLAIAGLSGGTGYLVWRRLTGGP
jgi:hypothetical protein